MSGPIFNALTGLRNAPQRLQNSADNVANINTAGFKKSDVNSVELKSGGTWGSDISRSNTQGGLIPTGNPLDFAIDGNGFFQVTNPNGGTSFTRSGSFKQDGAGNIVDASGNALVPAINIPGNNTGISVDATGQVSAQVGEQPEVSGQITLANFQNPSGLTAAGGLGTVRSGFLEGSNVDITEEIVDQIAAKAAFKVNVIKANDELLGTILDIKT